MKRKIKVDFIGFETQSNGKKYINGVSLEKTWLYKTLEKNYDIEISKKPDYIICGCFNLYEYCKYPQVRIMYSGENYVPDFNFIDYAISSYPIEFFDRNFYLPQSLFGYDGERKELEARKREYTKDFLKSKTRFANFIASYDSENNFRGDFFKKLNEIKKVDSAGRWLNNTGVSVSFRDDSKVNFQRQCKFSLCFESAINAGFNTEKIMDAFYAETIPVYFGDPKIADVFNPAAFINVADYPSFDDAIEKILELDADDDKYLEMLNQPIFKEENYISSKFSQAEEYLLNIFEQPIEKAYRRSRVVWPRGHEEFINQCIPLYTLVYKNGIVNAIRNFRRKLRKFRK